MSIATIRKFSGDDDKGKVVAALVNAFPQRSDVFFESAIDGLDSANSKLYLMEVDDEVVGSCFGFRVEGYTVDAWSPSYLHVKPEYRSHSLFFIMRVFKYLSSAIIDVSPSDDVKKILSALKYKEINRGSRLFPVIQSFFYLRNQQRLKIKVISSPFSRFQSREDLLWFTIHVDGGATKVAVKKAQRYSFNFFVLVYFEVANLNNILMCLISELRRINPFAILILPDFSYSLVGFSVKSNKFHTFSNMEEFDGLYSVLGSEITEVI